MSHIRLLLAAAVVLCGLGVAVAPAHAARAEIRYSEGGQGSSYWSSVYPAYIADLGEQNELTISSVRDAHGASAILFTDPGAVIVPEDGCFSLISTACAAKTSTNTWGSASPPRWSGTETTPWRTATTASVFGEDGDDVLLGSSGNDRLLGLEGDDVIRAGGGRDSVDGGLGTDSVNGGADNDRLADQGGNRDRVDGGPGSDTLDLSSRRRSLRIDLAYDTSGEPGEDDAVPEVENAIGGHGGVC